MFERIKRKKEPEPIVLSDEQLLRVIKQLKPEHIIPDYILEDLEETLLPKYQFEKWVESLSRPALLALEDSKQIVGQEHEDDLWPVIWNEQWKRVWPIGKYNHDERLPDMISSILGKYKLSDLGKQVEGIQKKLDRVLILMKDKEFCIDGETALKL